VRRLTDLRDSLFKRAAEETYDDPLAGYERFEDLPEPVEPTGRLEEGPYIRPGEGAPGLDAHPYGQLSRTERERLEGASTPVTVEGFGPYDQTVEGVPPLPERYLGGELQAGAEYKALQEEPDPELAAMKMHPMFHELMDEYGDLLEGEGAAAGRDLYFPPRFHYDWQRPEIPDMQRPEPFEFDATDPMGVEVRERRPRPEGYERDKKRYEKLIG